MLVAEFESPDALVAGAEHLRSLGFVGLDAYTPFPVPELDDILGVRRSRVPKAVFLGGAAGATLAYSILSWTNAVDYPLNVGGRPYNSLPAHVPIVFETLVLFASFASFITVLVSSRMPRLHDPIFDIAGFERTTIDRFWLTVGDPRRAAGSIDDEQADRVRSALVPLGALTVRAISRRTPSEAP
ncbi:DUF3341 domain-containing protein [Labilithrix luteola]|nr:DUF3341 domain-containing protein [Labilithrix luteola]